MQSNLG